MRDAPLIANAIISWCNKYQKPIDNLKLQKLLYLVQGLSLAIIGERAFNEPIEAWRYGPVVRSVYQQAKIYRDQQITKTLPTSSSPRQISGDLKAVINLAMTRYADLTGPQLIEVTHNAHVYPEAKPWVESFDEVADLNFSGAIIPPRLMQTAFKELLRG